MSRRTFPCFLLRGDAEDSAYKAEVNFFYLEFYEMSCMSRLWPLKRNLNIFGGIQIGPGPG